MKNRLITTVCGLLFCLSGCSSHGGTYPKEWGNFVLEIEKNGCLNISGKYQNIGKPAKTNPDSDSPYAQSRSRLSTIFYPSLFDIDITHVEFTWLDLDTLEITFWQDHQIIFKKQFSKSAKDVFCRSTSIDFEHTALESLPEGQGMTVKRIHLSLSKTSDGSLVVNFKSVNQGLALFVIPYGGSSSYWHRHARIN